MRTRDFHAVEGRIRAVAMTINDIEATMAVFSKKTTFQGAVRGELRPIRASLVRRLAKLEAHRKQLLATER